MLEVNLTDDGTSSIVFTAFADDEVVADIDLGDIDLTGVVDSGWVVTEPHNVEGGAAARLRRDGVVPEQVAALVDDLDGGTLFEVAAVEVVPSIARTDYRVELAAAPSIRVGDFSDDELVGLFDGQPFGEMTSDLETLAGTDLDELVTVTVRAVVPTSDAEVASVSLASGAVVTAVAESTSIDQQVLDARDEAGAARREYDRAWRWVVLSWAAAAVVAAVLVMIRRRKRPTDPAPTI